MSNDVSLKSVLESFKVIEMAKFDRLNRSSYPFLRSCRKYCLLTVYVHQRQTDRLTHRLTHRQTDRQTDRQTHRLTAYSSHTGSRLCYVQGRLLQSAVGRSTKVCYGQVAAGHERCSTSCERHEEVRPRLDTSASL